MFNKRILYAWVGLILTIILVIVVFNEVIEANSRLEKVVVALVLIALVSYPIYLFIQLGLRQSRNRRILKTGREAIAVVRDISETSGGTVSINGQPYLVLTLEIHDGDQPPYIVSLETIVPRFAIPQYQPGEMLQVKIDPDNPEHVAVSGVITDELVKRATSEVPEAPGIANEQQLEQLLVQHQAEHEKISEIGLEAVAKVLQYMPMGFTVNGNNPAVNLLVEVQSAGGSAFTAQIECVVIAKESADKFRPGQMVTVRYDPNDLARVALQHSGV